MIKSFIKLVFTQSILLVFVVILFTNIVVAQQTIDANTQEKSVLEVVDSEIRISEFARLLQQSGYVEVLKKKGYYTILAPTNDAFTNVKTRLKENPRKLIKGHLFKGHIPKDKITPLLGVHVREVDSTASNGIVYIIDEVLQQ